MPFSCPIRPSDFYWKRAVQRADAEHEAHISLAREIGIASAVEQLVREKRSGQTLTRVALRLFGFLMGFILGVFVAFLVGQTKSAGVLAVFGAACLWGVLAPIPFRKPLSAAVETFRGEIVQELSSAAPG